MNLSKVPPTYLTILVFLLVSSLLTPAAVASVRMTPQESSAGAASLLLVNAWLIDGTGAPVWENAWVHIRKDRIVAVGKGSPPSVPGARRIDLKGKTVIPGLSDMHAHLGTLDRARWMLKTLLAYGVTTVRDTGNEIGHIAAIRRDVEGQEAIPALYFGGPMMNGNFAERRFLREGTRLQMQLEELTAFGLDFLKHHHWVTTTAVQQIARHAEKHGLYVVGRARPTVPRETTGAPAGEARSEQNRRPRQA